MSGLLLRTVALASMTIAVTIGLARVFDSPTFLVPLLAVAGLGHVVAAATRRISGVGASIVMLLLGAVVSIDVSHWSSTTWAVPTPWTFEVIHTHLESSRQVLVHGSAPTTPSAGFLLVAAAALWITAWSGDRLVFHFRTPLEAIAPASTVFLVTTLLAGPDHRWLAAGVFALAVAFHLVVERAVSRSGAIERPVAERPARLWRSVVTGTMMAGCAIVAGLGIAAVVPALRSDAALPVRDRIRDGPPRSVVSPLVDIRSRLVEQNEVEMFRVRTNEPAYWRLMTLDDFDGTVWSADQSYSDAPRTLPADDDTASTATPSKQISATYDLTGLDGPWAPVAYRPVELTGTDALLWDAAGSTLIARASVGGVTGLRYRVTSQLPNPSRARSATAEGVFPEAVRRSDLELPGSFPPELRRTAHRITDGASSPYEKALALQNYFRDGFTYSTDIRGGENTDAIERFLSERKGFCEQFAGTYAAFARAVGLPTRIAVGFTPGTPTENGYTVRGRDAHAWPEVYFAGLGWLAFEPTPGRGNPSASSYTGVQPRLNPPQGPPPTTGPAPGTETGTTVASPSPAPPTTSTPRSQSPVAPASEQGPSSGWPPGWIGILVAAVVVVTIGPLTRWLRRNRRRRAADTPAKRMLMVWTETLESWRPLRFIRDGSDTDRDLGRRLASRLENLDGSELLAPSALRLAELATRAAWNAPAVTESDLMDATIAADALTRTAREHRSWWSRLIGWFDPGLSTLRYSRNRSRSRSC